VRTPKLAILVAALTSGCADGQSFLDVMVTGNVAGIDHFNVRVTNQGQTAKVTYQPSGAPTALPFDFALTFDASRRGTVDVNVEAWSASQLLASGEAMANLQPSHGATISVALTPGVVVADLGGGADFSIANDLAGVDLAGPRDLAIPVLFGETQVEPSTDNHAAGLADASNFVASASGTVHTLTVYFDSGDATELLIGLYDDASNHPNNLLAQGTVSNPIVGNWSSATVPSTAVVSGTTYWIALVAPVGHGNTFSFRYGSGGGGNITTEHSTQSNLTTLPASWSTGATFPGTFCSFYASP
jgi:hypothetical protein